MTAWIALGSLQAAVAALPPAALPPGAAAKPDSASAAARPAAETPSTVAPAGQPAASALGNPKAGAVFAPSDAPHAGGVQEVGPEIYYLPDEHGKLRPVPGWTLEDFRKLVEQQASRQQTPRYSLHRLIATGTAEGDHAQLKVELTIRLYGQRPGDWVRVPLQMAGAILRDAPHYSGDGSLFLEYQDNADGYVAWLRGDSEKPHQLSLEMLVPLETIGEEHRLSLNLPRATPSQLKLVVPLTQVEVDVSEGATMLAPVVEAKGSELTVLGLSGDFHMAWRPLDQRFSPRSRLLEVEGTQLVRIDRGQIRTQAQLKVHSLAGEFDRFRVKLPSGARLVSEAQPGYTIAPVERPSRRASKYPVPVLEIKLDKRTRGPVEVRLTCEQTHDLNRPQETVQLAGFEVEGAVRQWGNIAVQVTGDWHVLWGEATNVRRVDTLPASLPNDDLAAGFEYFSEPYQLAARIVPPSTRISLEPEYLVDVAADGNSGGARLKLAAKLKYLVSGARVFDLSVDLAGWQLDEAGLGPASRVNLANVVPPVGDRLKIPLTTPLKGEFEITLKAHRQVARAAAGLSIELPRPEVQNLGTTTLMILPADNVQLTPQRDAMVGLVPLPVAPPIEHPPREQIPFSYRSDQPNPRFVADFQVHAQEVACDVVSQVRLAERVAEVSQTLDFNVAYEPVEWLTLEVPRELASPESLQVSLGAETLVPLAPRPADASKAAPTTLPMRVALKKPRIGRLPLTIKYRVELEKIASGLSVPILMPLVMPAEARLRSNQLVIEPTAGITVEPAAENWSPLDEVRGGYRDDAQRRYLAKSTTPHASLRVSMRERPAAGAIVIHRGWVQTWLTPGGRHDQAMYLLSSRDDQLAIGLPERAEPAATEVWVDGKPVPPQADANGLLVVRLPRTAAEDHRLVLRYLVPDRGNAWLRSASTPHFPAGTWVQKMYWQLVLPPDERLLCAPAGTTPEYTWQWRRLGWSRESLLSESDLTEWVGVAKAESPVPALASRYLLSISTTDGAYALSIVPRALLLLVSAGFVLGLGLLLIYVPLLRGPGVLFSAAVVLLGLGLLYPEPALLMSQTAVLGLGLVILVGVLRRLLVSRSDRPIVLHGKTGSSMRHATTEFFYQSGAMGAGNGPPASTSEPSPAPLNPSTVTKI